eukprot:216542-Amphidinium_carterae.1
MTWPHGFGLVKRSLSMTMHQSMRAKNMIGTSDFSLFLNFVLDQPSRLAAWVLAESRSKDCSSRSRKLARTLPLMQLLPR